jgi:DNA-binding NtrC family response regulator
MTMSGGVVLVVEDKENMLELVKQILAPHHDVVTAADGTGALALLQARAFDVVLTDVRMPGADGFEVVRLTKERWPTTEVIMMTAFASIPNAVEAIRLGAYDYIQKPFDPDDLSLVVARALESGRSRKTVEPPILDGTPRQVSVDPSSLSYQDAMNVAQKQSSHDYLVALLRAFDGNVSRAAERAGMERESLHRLLRRYGLKAEGFRIGGSPTPTSSS